MLLIIILLFYSHNIYENKTLTYDVECGVRDYLSMNACTVKSANTKRTEYLERGLAVWNRIL